MPDTVVAQIKVSQREPPLDLTLRQLMQTYKIPGLSVAVIENYAIAWAKGYGITTRDGKVPVRTTTLFQAASISKPVTAAGALWLVEHGKLSLDEDVNQELKTWKVPENEFTGVQKVTLRRILSHSAGLTVHGFPGYAVAEPLPTLVQILSGEKPANTDPIRVDYVPGSRFRYSGGGVTIEQQLIIDVTGLSFPQFMKKRVLDKVGMHESTYEEPLPASLAGAPATGTHADGQAVEGKWHVYPEMAAAGLWTTPTDLAKFAIEIALSKQGKANHVLSKGMTQEMLTPQVHLPGNDKASVGLGFFLGGDKRSDEFGHTGGNDGFQAFLVMLSDSGQGIALMANSDSTQYLFPHVIRWVAKDRKWNYTSNPVSPGELLTLLASIRGTQSALDYYQEIKQKPVAQFEVDTNTLIELGYFLFGENKTEDATKVLELNVREHPTDSNAFDSLAEVYMAAGKKELAIQSCENALKLNPADETSAQMLKKLKAKSTEPNPQ